MKKTLKSIAAGLLAVPMLALGLSFVPIATNTAAAACTTTDELSLDNGACASQGNGQSDCLFTTASCQNGIFTTITNVLLYIIGAVAVIMLIIGGIRYVVSGGDSSAVQNAKNTILYAVIGIIVAILAYSVVNFVITNIKTS